MTIEKLYNIGEVVWVARCGQIQVQKPCPVCFGRRSVTLILGNEEHVVLPCEYCGLGSLNGPRGYEMVYEYHADPQTAVITGRSVEEGPDGSKVRYSSAPYGLYPEDIFDNEPECRARCEVKRAEHEAEQGQRNFWGKEKAHKSFAWHLGYHRREAKEAQRKLEYHTRMAGFCKERAKPEKVEKEASIALVEKEVMGS